MNKIGFNNHKYLTLQSENIRKRINHFGGKLYLEFGGKLFDDYHASRVLPGFMPDSKLRMLLELKDEAEMVIVINADDIEKNKIRGDLGITYKLDVLRLIDAFRDYGLYVGSVVLTRFNNQPDALKFQRQLESFNIKVYRHYSIEGYPSNIELIVSKDGYGKNDYIETTRHLVVVTAPGPGSGKMAVCLSQLYNEYTRGITAGYAKFETFPIWNLPLKHPVNLAYEAATTDLNDVNMIDPFHLEAYGITCVNYNRDVEIFPVLDATFKKIYGKSPYKSPTDMGVNMAGYCIEDNEVVEQAAKQEIIRRYFTALCELRKGNTTHEIVTKHEILMQQAGINISDRKIVQAALDKSEKNNNAKVIAIELKDGRIITGKASSLLSASSAMVLNALKTLSGIPDNLPIISPELIAPIQSLKKDKFHNNNIKLHSDEVLLVLAICASTSPLAKAALEKVNELRGCELHSTEILSQADEKTLKKLGFNITMTPQFATDKVYNN